MSRHIFGILGTRMYPPPYSNLYITTLYLLFAKVHQLYSCIFHSALVPPSPWGRYIGYCEIEWVLPNWETAVLPVGQIGYSAFVVDPCTSTNHKNQDKIILVQWWIDREREGRRERERERERERTVRERTRDNITHIFHDLKFLQVCSLCVHQFSDIFLSFYLIFLHVLEQFTLCFQSPGNTLCLYLIIFKFLLDKMYINLELMIHTTCHWILSIFTLILSPIAKLLPPTVTMHM